MEDIENNNNENNADSKDNNLPRKLIFVWII